MTFKVIDNKTDGEPNLEDIVLNEEWAYSSNLIHCDMEGFAITDSGDLIMLDECGNYEFCPQGRFTVVQDSVIDKIRAEIEGWQGDIHDNEYDADKYDFVFEPIFDILDKYKAESEKG